MNLIWATVALAALWWPSRIAGPLDGAPLTGQLESILLGFVVPILWWFHRPFFRSRLAQFAVVALVVLKIASAFPNQEGMCVRFNPHRPIVRGSSAPPHSWDLRADWRAADPQCSAVMTAPYTTFKEFPVWFFNLPPTDSNLPTFEDRPPGATTDVTIVGYVNAGSAGLLEVVTGPGMNMTIVVDGQPAEHPNELSHRIQLDAGVHFVQASGTLTENHWQFMPSWNRALLGSSGFPTATISRPTSIDRPLVRSVLRWSLTIVIAIIVVAWIVSAFAAFGTPVMTAWTVFASVVLGYLAPRAGNGFVTGNVALFAISALAAACFVPAPKRERALRDLFFLIGIPFLAFIGVASIDHAGKFSLYAAGDDMWMFQRLTYRTYLEGYFLEGGQPSFIHQPLYRWIAGALHLLFGDSSMGEFLWDGVCFAAIALFAGEVARRLAGVTWGLVATATTLTLIMRGPTWTYWGVGLSEIASAGLIYMAALTAITAENWSGIIAVGVLATCGFYTRLNNLPIAVSVALFAIPLATPASDAFRPSRWFPLVSRRLAGVAVGSLIVGMLLLGWRSWHYTGVFSLTYGSQFSSLSLWQPGLTITELFNRLLDSVLMVLTMNDPPRLSWYSIPPLAAAVMSIGALIGVPLLGRLSLPLTLFFLAGASGALIARGSAYSGRFSIIIIGASCAVCVSAVAVGITLFRSSATHRPAGS